MHDLARIDFAEERAQELQREIERGNSGTRSCRPNLAALTRARRAVSRMIERLAARVVFGDDE